MAMATIELAWVRTFLAYLGLFHAQPMKLFCDGQVALPIVKNLVFHERTKHIKIDCSFVHKKLFAGLLSLSYMTSKLHHADILTKALGKRQFQFLKSQLGIINLYALT